MTASEQAKAAGLKSLTQAAKMMSYTTQYLRNCQKHHPQRFEIILLGCIEKLKQ